MPSDLQYFRVRDVAEALDLLGRHGAGIKLLAGGTDLVVEMRDRGQSPDALIDISDLQELAGIQAEPGVIAIGAGTRIGDILKHPLMRDELPALAEACRRFGDYLTRNKATVGGNLANASPGADLAVPLLALDASVRLVSSSGDRVLPLDDFLLGRRRTARTDGELLREVAIPRPAAAGQAYEKLGLRRGGAIAVVSNAVSLQAVDGRCQGVRVALGAVAARPIRSREAEQLLENQPLRDEFADRAADAAAAEAQPITDVRGSAEYRRAMVRALVRRTIDAAWSRATQSELQRRDR